MAKVHEVFFLNSLRIEYEADGYSVRNNPETGTINYVELMKDGEVIVMIHGDQFVKIEVKEKPNVS